MSKSILVTGGSGFIGAALVKRLVVLGWHVRVLDNNSRGKLTRIQSVIDDIEFVQGDIRDKDLVHGAAKGMDSVCHLAFINGTQFFYEKPEFVLDVAIRGMLNVVDACRANDIGDLIVASSSEVYQTPAKVPTDETVSLLIPDIKNPRYSYGGGKILLELMAMNYGRTSFDRVTIFRPHNVYGSDMGWEHVIPQLTVKAVKAIAATNQQVVPIDIQGDGLQTRAFVHIDDFTDGLIKVIQNGKHLEIYHIGTDEEVSIREVAEKIVSHLGKEPQFISGPEAVGGTHRRCPDISKLKHLGYQPQIKIADGIGAVVDWYKQHIDESIY
jgi:nucleoside-diphosphate-sugar epimerase